MAKFSKLLLDQLSEFMIHEIAKEAIDGITYTMLLKNNAKDKERYQRYMLIKKEVLNCGFPADSVFRVFEVSNGYIFDMDINVTKQILKELSKSVQKTNKNINPNIDFIGDSPERRRNRDLNALGKYVESEFNKGNTEVNVALFSRNSNNKIEITGKDSNGQKVCVRYKAYAIRHWDIEALNANILMPHGIKIVSMQPCEILPSKNGIVFRLISEEM